MFVLATGIRFGLCFCTVKRYTVNNTVWTCSARVKGSLHLMGSGPKLCCINLGSRRIRLLWCWIQFRLPRLLLPTSISNAGVPRQRVSEIPANLGSG
jgi:hypothetical protein